MGWLDKLRGKDVFVGEELPERAEDPEAEIPEPDDDAPEPECVDPDDEYNS